jgi:hypothetical protein
VIAMNPSHGAADATASTTLTGPGAQRPVPFTLTPKARAALTPGPPPVTTLPRRVYLAARYSRRLELCGYRAALAQLGIAVTSRWLNGCHQLDNQGVPITDDGERRFEAGDPAVDHLREHFATEDVADVLAADTLVAFTEQPRAAASRGGRHVEFGIALAARKQVVIVGPRENVFCWLPHVQHHATWPDFMTRITAAEPVTDCGCGHDDCSACAGHRWACRACGAAWFSTPPGNGLCAACQPAGGIQ